MVDLNGVTPLRGVCTSCKPQAQKSSSHSNPPISKDLVNKSLPQLVALAADLANAPPPVDQAKIAEIRDAISSGRYKVDPDSIARALLGGAE